MINDPGKVRFDVLKARKREDEKEQRDTRDRYRALLRAAADQDAPDVLAQMTLNKMLTRHHGREREVAGTLYDVDECGTYTAKTYTKSSSKTKDERYRRSRES